MSLDRSSQDRIVEALIHNTPIAYIVLDDQYRIHFLNDSFLELRNLSREETLGELCYNISNKGIPCAQCAVRVALESKKPEIIHRKDVLPDDCVRYIDDYAIPLKLKAADGAVPEEKGSGQASRTYILEIMTDRSSVMNARAKRTKALSDILKTLVEILESKDGYTALHSRHVHYYARRLAEGLGLPEQEVDELAIAGLLHDIGKVEISREIINKPGKLNDAEYTAMKEHPVFGDGMLEGFSSFERIRTHVRHHHERVDGAGYPDALGNEHLSLGAKVLAVADTYDAMTTDRSYRKARTQEEAFEELRRVKGTQLDASLVDCFVTLDLSGEKTALGQEDTKTNEVVRRLSDSMVKTENLKEMRAHMTYKSEVDENELLRAIFDNTPCGYALFDKNSQPVFASDYYLDYRGITQAQFLETRDADEIIARSLLEKETLHEMRTEFLGGQDKTYELFSIPVIDDELHESHVIWCIIDRSEEIEIAHSFDCDFVSVIRLIRALISRRFDNEASKEQIEELEESLWALERDRDELLRV